jgi:Ca2+-binding RTX toxin-like protein
VAQLQANLRLGLDGGAGNDTFMMNVGGFMMQGGFMMHIDGGAGNDRASVDLDFSAVAQPDDVQFRADLGGGDDTFMMNVQLGATPTEREGGDPHIQFDVLGSAGNDDLTLKILETEDEIPSESNAVALVDGGRGIDTARVTRDVRVANCEKVIYLDEPPM